MAKATTFRFPLPSWNQWGYGYGESWPLASCGGTTKRHTGIDVAARAGDPVKATANGRIYGSNSEGSSGHILLIEHSVPGEGTVISRYGHVKPRAGYGAGRIVSRGERVATVYDQGSPTHLSFGIHAGRYTPWAWRGALPRTDCGGDPAFPAKVVDPTKYVRVHMDVTPPRTRAAASSTERVRDRWTRGEWSVQLRCKDDLSGCARTVRRLDDGQIRTGKRLTINSEGRHVLRFRSIDERGNRGDWRRRVFGIDRTAPRVGVDEPSSGVLIQSDDLRLRAWTKDPDAGTPAGASKVRAVRFVICAIDDSGCSSVLAAKGDEGWVARGPRLEPGSYEISARAKDRAGNIGVSEPVALLVLATE